MSPLQTSDERINRLRESVVDAPTIWKGDYAYFIHPLSDGVPRQSGEMLEEARDIVLEMVDWDNIDLILGIEAMGIPLAACLSIKTGIPLVIGRKRPYELPGEVTVDQSTGYSKGSIFINDVKANERVFVVDDVITRYPADGNWYIIDTNKKHTAVNASWEDRIHIIGNLHDKTY